MKYQTISCNNAQFDKTTWHDYLKGCHRPTGACKASMLQTWLARAWAFKRQGYKRRASLQGLQPQRQWINLWCCSWDWVQSILGNMKPWMGKNSCFSFRLPFSSSTALVQTCHNFPALAGWTSPNWPNLLVKSRYIPIELVYTIYV